MVTDERLAEMLAEVEDLQREALNDADADQNPMLAVDAVGEFALSEMRSIITELQSLRAQGGVRVKGLHWEQSSEGYADGQWFSLSMFGEYHTYMHKPSGRAWLKGPGLEGFHDDIDAAKAAAQADYERRILSSFEASPAPVSEEITRWRQNSIDTWSAMTAMRNDINEYIPMPGIEGDLLQGPENSVFCAEVAMAVVSYVAEMRDLLVSSAVFVAEKYEPAIDSEYDLHQRLTAALAAKGGQ